MAEELDVVDIEGDEYEVNMNEFETGGILQDQYLHSAWKTNSRSTPWTLDSSISAENREVIENMLLEEEYYLSGKAMPGSVWTSGKQTVKRSPAKPAAVPARWAQEEKDLFEKGLAQFGRRWTKIAELVGSRTVLQVKTYAKKHCRRQDKSSTGPKALLSKPLLGLGPGSSSAPGRSGRGDAAALANAVRIERLSDDEDVDITDGLSNDDDDEEGETAMGEQSEDRGGGSGLPSSAPECPHTPQPEEGSAEPREAAGLQTCPSPQPGSPERGDLSGEEGAVVEGVYESEEALEEELRAPEQEVHLDVNNITEEEKQAIPEFFEGRSSKTPERYMKIRNFILEQWLRCRPKYLNKTSVRPGLKNCGDVNCIGRIHTYLELIGAINFSCEQAIYNRPRLLDRSRVKENRDALEAYQLAQRLQSMRSRRRRVRDVWGNWCDAKHLEGQTYEHLSAEELALRKNDTQGLKPNKASRQRGLLDPFQLIPCRSFGEEKQEPFQVMVKVEALVVMDMHAHASMGEVIGLLGGVYSEEEKGLKICAAEPCNSLSTGMQCEMDPLSQTQASELLSTLGLGVVGWYHSHPTFDPNPSLRDIDTQAKFQSYFSRGGAPFIGMIVSPYNYGNPSPHSQITCLMVQEEPCPSGSLQKLPFSFELLRSPEEPDWVQVMRRAQWVANKYGNSLGSVPMDRLFRRDSSLTCLEKMLASLRNFLEPLAGGDVEPFLIQIKGLFLSVFTRKQTIGPNVLSISVATSSHPPDVDV